MLAHAHTYIYWVHVHIDHFYNGCGHIQANFQVAGSNIWVSGLEQLTRSVWTNGVIKLAASMLFTCEKLKAYYYVSGWVGTCHIHIISEEFCLLKAKVRPSQ